VGSFEVSQVVCLMFFMNIALTWSKVDWRTDCTRSWPVVNGKREPRALLLPRESTYSQQHTRQPSYCLRRHRGFSTIGGRHLAGGSTHSCSALGANSSSERERGIAIRCIEQRVPSCGQQLLIYDVDRRITECQALVQSQGRRTRAASDR
jgi:hypothetical protein